MTALQAGLLLNARGMWRGHDGRKEGRKPAGRKKEGEYISEWSRSTRSKEERERLGEATHIILHVPVEGDIYLLAVVLALTECKLKASHKRCIRRNAF